MVYTEADKLGLVPVNRENKTLQKTQSNTPDIPTFDLQSLNLLQVCENVKQQLNSCRSGFIFLRRRANEKTRLDLEQMQQLVSLINLAREANSELIKMQAEVFLSKSMLENIISRYYVQAKHEVELTLKINEDQLSQLEHAKRARELVIEAGELANLRTKAEINLMTATEEEKRMKTAFIKKVIDSEDYENIPRYLKDFVIASIANPSKDITNEMQLMDELKAFMVSKAEAEAEKLKADARRRHAEADEQEVKVDFQKWKQEKTKKDIS